MTNKTEFSLAIDAEDIDEPDAPRTVRRDPAGVLVELALDRALTPPMRKRLKQKPGLYIFEVPDRAWVPLVCREFKSMKDSPVISDVTDAKKGANAKDYLDVLRDGESLLFVTPDAKGLLDEEIVLSANLAVSLPPLSAALLRQTIRRVTGGVARGLGDDCCHLPLNIVLASLRLAQSAGQCVRNLNRAAERMKGPRAVMGPRLEDIPLAGNVRAWTQEAVSSLTAVGEGRQSPESLAHVVLEGPPGTGKTLIAHALAASSGWRMVESSVGSWFSRGDGHLGGVIKSIQAFFDDALTAAPAIAFLDEIDALPSRADLDARSREWWTPVVTMVLTQIDRVRRSGRKVLLIGATNYYNRLDSALTRPGRLEKRVSVLPPATEKDALALIEHFAGGTLPRQELAAIAKLAIGATPAHIEAAWKQAWRLSRLEDRAPAARDLLAALLPEDDRPAADLEAIAIHEMGHAFVACRLGHDVESVSLLPSGNAEGHMLARAPSIILTRCQIDDEVTIRLAGRAADMVLGAGPHGGAADDLQKATEMLLAAQLTMGLGERLVSHAVLPPRNLQALADQIDHELNACLERATSMIAAERETVLDLARRLARDRIVRGEDIKAVLVETPQSPNARTKASSRSVPLLRGRSVP